MAFFPCGSILHHIGCLRFHECHVMTWSLFLSRSVFSQQIYQWQRCFSWQQSVFFLILWSFCDSTSMTDNTAHHTEFMARIGFRPGFKLLFLYPLLFKCLPIPHVCLFTWWWVVCTAIRQWCSQDFSLESHFTMMAMKTNWKVVLGPLADEPLC